MIKLIKLLELEKPQNIYAPGQEPGEAPEKDLMQKGFKLGKATIDPETGASVTDVTYLPAFETLRRQALTMRKEFQPFKFSSNEDIAKVAKDANAALYRAAQLVLALDKMLELQRTKQ
jgi:hypothetical protein